jgi:uncharacterized RDD family membrane protein YckC
MTKLIKKNLYKLFSIAYILVILSFPAVMHAITAPPNPPSGTTGSTGIVNPLGSNITTIPAFIKVILVGALKLGIPALAVAFIICGLRFVKARGNPEEITKAKLAFLWTSVGGFTLLGSLAVATVIFNTVNALMGP